VVIRRFQINSFASNLDGLKDAAMLIAETSEKK
jgi:hypothetical protein